MNNTVSQVRFVEHPARFQPTLLSGVGVGATRISRGSCRLPWDRRVSSEYHLLLARDLRFINDEEYAATTALAIQAKRMLSTFIKRLGWAEPQTVHGQVAASNGTADSRQPTADSR